MVRRPADVAASTAKLIAERKGMRIMLDYSSSMSETMLYIDGAPQGDPIRGREFFRGLLRIWLGERPAQADLKRLLLGQDEDAKE